MTTSSKIISAVLLDPETRECCAEGNLEILFVVPHEPIGPIWSNYDWLAAV